MQNTWSICANQCPCVRKSNCVTEQVSLVQGFPPSNNPYSNIYNHGWRNYPNFLRRSQNVENFQTQSSRPNLPGF